MSDKMLPIFVSSTFIDLEEYRESVRNIIRQIGAIDIAMENLGARDERPKDECLRLIRNDSKAFVGIYAHRYGHIPAGDTCSITESEYKAASEVGLKRLIYIIDDNTPWQKKFIDQGKKAKLLDDFKKRLRTSHICKSFKNKDDLSASVAVDIAHEFTFSTYPRVGSRKQSVIIRNLLKNGLQFVLILIVPIEISSWPIQYGHQLGLGSVMISLFI